MNSEEYIKKYLNQKDNFKVNKNVRVALIGLGPHAKRIYLNYFKKHKINLDLVVELESRKEYTKNYLEQNGFKNTKIYSLNDKYKDFFELPSNIESNLLSVCETLEITHIVIATEPKAHNMYLKFALKNNINVLTDKPITVTKNMTSIRSINKVRKQYYDILNLANHSKAMCKVMCQRQYHRGYEYIKKLLEDTVEKYQVPITYIEIYHCDGNWEMAHDLDKENHPYKYGYGKLFHSGYHFIDLLSDFIKINDKLKGSKKIVNGKIYSNCFTPDDEINVFNFDDYKRIFKNQNIPPYYNDVERNYKKYGEKNFYSLMKFTNNRNQTITNVNLNLLHYGFSRRGWIESKDYYKNNGRIRHEHINIQVGSLLNIQVHSYQSKEIKDRTKDMALEEKVGGLEHFDIDIYRNVDIIGGQPFERIPLGSLYTDKEKKDFLGYNELSREIYLSNFFKGKCTKGDIKDQALSLEILHSCAMGIHNHYQKKEKVENITVRNQYTYPFKIEDLKQYANKENLKIDKELISTYERMLENYNIGISMNYVPVKKEYEVYLYIESGNMIVSGLLLRKFKFKPLAKIYEYYLKKLANKENIQKIVKKVELKGD